MAERPAHRLALLSVHPEFATALLNGTKRVEFRKRALAPDVTHVAIYATKPVGRVVGVFSIEEQVVATPQHLWRTFADVAGISRPNFFAYYGDTDRGVGIRVGRLVGFDRSMSLQEAFGISHAPQSFQYFEAKRANRRLIGALT